jgi:PAS domain S-box-containing protein
MDEPARILIVEDSEADAALLDLALSRGGMKATTQRVETAEDMRATLASGRWDAIICDFVLPRFSARDAFDLMKKMRLDLPFLVMSGVVRMTEVVDLVRAGAHDFIEKDELARLVPSLERGLQAAEERGARRRAEEALRENDFRLRAITDNLPGVVFRRVLDRDGNISYPYISSGVRHSHGREAEEVMADPVRYMENPHPEDRARLMAETRRSAERLTPLMTESRIVGPDGDIKWIESRALPTRLPDGCVAWDGIALDITERKAMAEELRRAQKLEAIGHLTGGVAHDFNNLLTIIVGNLELARESLVGDQELSALVREAEDAANRGATLTERLLAFSRKQVLKPRPTDVNAMVTGMLDLLRRGISETVEMRTTLADDAWPVLVDSSQPENAILNLAVNARDAMEDGGAITIETANVHFEEGRTGRIRDAAPGDYLGLAVSDTGSGMSPEVIAHAFEPFFTTKGAGKGNGLRLSMVYDLIEQSGGYLEIDSTLGRGTTIEIYLPRTRAIRGTPAVAVEQIDVPRGRGETILLVEDNPSVRRVAAKALALLGYELVEAAEATTALGILESRRDISLLFTDVVLPGGIKGIELIRRARGGPWPQGASHVRLCRRVEQRRHARPQRGIDQQALPRGRSGAQGAGPARRRHHIRASPGPRAAPRGPVTMPTPGRRLV